MPQIGLGTPINQSPERPRDTAPGQSASQYTSGTPQAAGRAVFLSITTTGTVAFAFADGTTISATFPTGIFEFNWAVTTVTLSGGAVGAAYNIL